MKAHETLNDTLQELRDFAIDKPEGCPDRVFALIRKQTSDLVSFGELLTTIYDTPVGAGDDDTIGPVLAQVAAAGLGVFAMSGFLDIGKDGRANRMRLALLREAGEPAPAGLSWPDPADDPARRPLPAAEPAGTPAA